MYICLHVYMHIHTYRPIQTSFAAAIPCNTCDDAVPLRTQPIDSIDGPLAFEMFRSVGFKILDNPQYAQETSGPSIA